MEQALTSEIQHKTPPGGKVSFDEFLHWTDENTHAECVMREPDLLFVTNEHRDWVKETYLDAPADFAIETVSPDVAPELELLD